MWCDFGHVTDEIWTQQTPRSPPSGKYPREFVDEHCGEIHLLEAGASVTIDSRTNMAGFCTAQAFLNHLNTVRSTNEREN